MAQPALKWYYLSMETEKELLEIKERNKKVELDKAWETSWFRRVFISVMTFIVAVVWLWLIGEPGFILKALVPALGYILSTLTIGPLKGWWIKRRQ